MSYLSILGSAYAGLLQWYVAFYCPANKAVQTNSTIQLYRAEI